MHFKYGCWVCDGKPFDHKIDALRHSTNNNNSPVSFYYHNNTWKNFDISQITNLDLDSLYKDRALQLRDRYKHLILYFSGGSDSNNILFTFLKNNIKLDEIVVRWTKPLRDGKFYTPNTIDTSAKNAPSEWNYSIKPTLEYVAKHHPDIKITILDPFENIAGNTNIDETVLLNRLSIVRPTRPSFATFIQRLHIDNQLNTFYKKDIGYMFGIEKPNLIIKDGWFHLIFTDTSLDPAIVENAKLEGNAEFFYWAPEMPNLHLTQALVLANFYNNNPQFLDLLLRPGTQNFLENSRKIELQGNIIKHVLYPTTWTDRFQAGKPNISRSDWWFILYENEEFKIIRDMYNKSVVDYISGISDYWIIKTTEAEKLILKPISTPSFPIAKVKEIFL